MNLIGDGEVKSDLPIDFHYQKSGILFAGEDCRGIENVSCFFKIVTKAFSDHDHAMGGSGIDLLSGGHLYRRKCCGGGANCLGGVKIA